MAPTVPHVRLCVEPLRVTRLLQPGSPPRLEYYSAMGAAAIYYHLGQHYSISCCLIAVKSGQLPGVARTAAALAAAGNQVLRVVATALAVTLDVVEGQNRAVFDRGCAVGACVVLAIQFIPWVRLFIMSAPYAPIRSA